MKNTSPYRLLRSLAAAAALAVYLPCAQAQAPVEIEIACFQGGYGIDFFEQCAREYEQEHPNVKIKLAGNPRIWEQLTPRFAAGTPPDVAWPGWGMNAWPLVFDGHFLPLDTYLDQPAHGDPRPWRETFMPSMLAKGQSEGKSYFIPYNLGAFGWWYNRKLFEANGWTAPKTYGEFLVLAEKMKAKGLAPVTFTGRYPAYPLRGFYLPWVISAGGLEVYTAAENLEPGAWKHPAFLRAAQTVIDLKKKEIFQTGCIGMNHTESQMEFLVGRAAMIPVGTWLYSEMKELLPAGFEMDFMLTPVYEDGKGEPSLIETAIDGFGWGVAAKSKHPDVGADFLRYMSSPAKAKAFLEQTGTLMGILIPGEVNPPPHLVTAARLAREAKRTWTGSINEWYPSMQTDLESAFLDLYNEEITPEQFVEECEEAATRIRNNPRIRKFKSQ